jgi:predicted transcriptional regulator
MKDILYSVFERKNGIKEIINNVNITADFFLYSITRLLLEESVVKIAGIENNTRLAI